MEQSAGTCQVGSNVLAGNVLKIMQFSQEDRPKLASMLMAQKVLLQVFSAASQKDRAPIEDKFQRQNEQMQHMRDVTEREIKALQGNMQKWENLKTKKV